LIAETTAERRSAANGVGHGMHRPGWQRGGRRGSQGEIARAGFSPTRNPAMLKREYPYCDEISICDMTRNGVTQEVGLDPSGGVRVAPPFRSVRKEEAISSLALSLALSTCSAKDWPDTH
jgi:hypothetical protein